MRIYGTPIRERTVEELKHGIAFNENTIKNLQAAIGENDEKDKKIGKLIESVNKTVGDLKKELKRKGGG